MELGKEFVDALGRKDGSRLKALLRRDVDFKGMTPSRFWEANTADDVVDDIMLGKWFEPSDEIIEILGVESAVVGGRERVGYQFRVKNPEGQYLVEQQAYLEADAEKIAWLRVMCSGFQRLD